ncbi:hypothetical protein OHT68_00430 [Streptomyces canus]|uniref:hypothetical protein n=1 Tax=Streptomyces canus TaxID=58343 RepID=UPI002E2D820F|nr:hypothetical protein [Streptomyces canus]
MLFVWFNWTGTSSAGISHAAVITKASGSNIYVTQHSHTRINEPIWKVTDALSWQAALTCPCGPPSPPNSDEVDAMRRLLTTGPVALLACVFLAGCSTKGPHLPDYVVLSKHVTHGVRWQLDAYLSDDGLCLTVDDPRGPEVSGDWSSGGLRLRQQPLGWLLVRRTGARRRKRLRRVRTAPSQSVAAVEAHSLSLLQKVVPAADLDAVVEPPSDPERHYPDTIFHDPARRLAVGDLTGTPRPVPPPTC